MHPEPGRRRTLIGGIWLIGLGVLFATRFWWPGIMFLIAITAFIEGWLNDQPWYGIQSGFWSAFIGVWALARYSLAFLLIGLGPGRPGWSPTQAPHRSGLAHHAHPVPHLMNSRPAGSVVVTWTWFRSQCTWHVSLQRLMRRHLLPSTGSLGLVPPLQRYYEVLRLPAAHFAALRFLRLAIPSLRPLFVPPGPGRGAVDQSGVGRRYLQPPCSMETT